jgi:hypothetical protein
LASAPDETRRKNGRAKILTRPQAPVQICEVAARLVFPSIAALVLLLTAQSLFGVSLGASKEDVIAELGKPTSQAARGEREILSYPRGVRIELVGGRVENATGLQLEIPEAAKPEPAPESKPPASAPAPALPKPADPRPAPTAAPEPAKSPSAAPAAALRIEKPTTQKAAPPPPNGPPALAPTSEHEPAEAEDHDASRQESYSDKVTHLAIAGMAALLGIHFVATLIGLKIAFKFWTMDALLTGIAAIALIDVALHGIFIGLAPMTSGISTMPAVENGVPGIVMIFSIRHFCFNKNLGDAIQTAAVVKLAVALLKMFGAMTLLGAVLG